MAKNAGAKKRVAIVGSGKMGSILLQSILRDELLKAGARLGRRWPMLSGRARSKTS